MQVQANIKAVLQTFTKVKPTVASGSINNAAADGSQESLTVKYLSSPRLLHLQLRDAGFRRHFLVQCLILLHACSRKSHNKQDTFKIKQVSLVDLALCYVTQSTVSNISFVLPTSYVIILKSLMFVTFAVT